METEFAVVLVGPDDVKVEMEMEAVKKTFDSRIEKVLLKLRKKATSALSIKAVTDALMALGYTVERENAWYELTRHEIRERGKGKSAREKNGIDWWANGSRDIRLDRNTYHPDEMAGVEANFRLRDASESDTERRLAKLRAAHKTAADLTVESLPEKVKVDRIVTTHIGEIVTKAKRYGVEHRFEWTAWIGRPAIDVTCPEGKTYRHFPRDESDYVLYGWLTKETLLVERASAALGLKTPDEERVERDYKARDWTNTGTCPCCFANVKLRDGDIVLHGYVRPGDGYTVGKCFGVRYEPYEVSTKGTENLRAIYKGDLARSKKNLAALKADDFTGPLKVDKGSARGPKWVAINLGDEGWALVLKVNIANIEMEIRHTERDIKTLTEKIDAWKPGMKMPEETARERGWR